jgi:hypothetical protein
VLKIIEATWLKRNIGITSKEVLFDGTESESDLKRIQGLTDEYIVVRLPVNCVELQFKLQDLGYYYVETMFDITYDLDHLGESLNKVARRIADSLTYEKMDEGDLKILWSKLQDNIFHTDRVYVDPYFTHEQAAANYSGWVRQVLDGGGTAYKCILKEKTVGFYLAEEKNGEFLIVISGLYKEYQNSGLGMGHFLAQFLHARDRGVKFSRGAVSTNNVEAIKANLAIGAQIVSAKAVLVKHITKTEE